MPSHLDSIKIKNDLDFEWLLCLASTLYRLQNGLPPPSIGADGKSRRRLLSGPTSANPSVQRNRLLTLRDAKNHG
jgi:hypothetical protein